MKQFFSKVVSKFLEWQVHRLLRTHEPTVIAVTGSVGKTSTKQAIAHVLGKKFRVLSGEGNYNTRIGLPLSIFAQTTPTSLTNVIAWLMIFWRNEQLIRGTYPYDVLVLEMGADRPGDIAHFVSYLEPDLGVLTAVSSAHLEGFGSVSAVLKEKWQLALGAKRVLVNADDSRLQKKVAELTDRPAYTYGVESGKYHIRELVLDSNDLMFDGKLVLGDKSVYVTFPTCARHSLYALVAAAAVGDISGLAKHEVVDRMQTFSGPKGRMNVLPGQGGARIIDDSYNSSPVAARAALQALKQLPGRHIAILGSMNELGEYEKQGHAEVGRACVGLAQLVTIGEAAEQFLAPAARAAGLRDSQIKSFTSPYEAGRWLAGRLQDSDVVLVKGSQNGVFSEEATALLLADPDDRAQLVRQSEAWQEIKRAQFPDAFE